MYTVSRHTSHPVAHIKDTCMLQCGHHSRQYRTVARTLCWFAVYLSCTQHWRQPGPLLFVHWSVTRGAGFTWSLGPRWGSLGRHLGLSPIQNGTGHQQRHLSWHKVLYLNRLFLMCGAFHIRQLLLRSQLLP